MFLYAHAGMGQATDSTRRNGQAAFCSPVCWHWTKTGSADKYARWTTAGWLTWRPKLGQTVSSSSYGGPAVRAGADRVERTGCALSSCHFVSGSCNEILFHFCVFTQINMDQTRVIKCTKHGNTLGRECESWGG